MNKYGSSMESLRKTMQVQMFKICIWNKQYMLHKTEQNMLFSGLLRELISPESAWQVPCLEHWRSTNVLIFLI
jgi:hypothetical protein